MLNVDSMPGVSLTGMSRKEWVERRVNSIGGSEIGAIMGFNKYKTPLQLYNEKLRITPYVDISEKDAVYWGNVLEPIVANEFAKQTGKGIAALDKIIMHPRYRYMTANIDRDVLNEDAGLECKTASAYTAADWAGEEIPESYILQCQWYMSVTGASNWFIACLIGGQKFVWKPVERDEEIIKLMENAAIDFWENHIQKRIPPVASAGDSRDFMVKYQDAVDLPEAADTMISELLAIKDDLDRQEENKKEIEARVKQMLNGHTAGITNQYHISWTQSICKKFNTALFKAENPALAGNYMKEEKRDNGLRVKRVG